MEGRIVKILTKLDPKLNPKYIQTERRKSILYIELKKALYGTLQLALLFWRYLTYILQEWGFEINPYDWCVANKKVSGKQITAVWHVDDLKLSQVEIGVVKEIIAQLSERCGKEVDLKIHIWKVHKYLVMRLEYRTQGKVKIDMKY